MIDLKAQDKPIFLSPCQHQQQVIDYLPEENRRFARRQARPLSAPVDVSRPAVG